MSRKVFALSGASGFVGAALCEAITARGDRVIRLVRGAASGDDERTWRPGGEAPPNLLDEVDTVIHLAGSPISVRWTPESRAAITSSRVYGTRTLASAVAATEGRTRLISTSAVGYFGDTGDNEVDEHSPQGSGFAAEVCAAWESEARSAGPSTAIVRVGLALAPHGGMLQQVLPIFRLGGGGPVGSGAQWMPWIALDDLVGIYLFLADHPHLAGPFIASAPQPVRNRDFARAMGRALRRPAFVPAPAAALKLVYGDMARELLLAGQRARPRALEEAGYAWRFTELGDALRHLLR